MALLANQLIHILTNIYMPLVSNSQDILFLVLAFCALWITALIAWLLYYVISITRQMHNTIASVKKIYQTVGSKVSLLKDNSLITMLASNAASILSSVIKSTYSKKKTKK